MNSHFQREQERRLIERALADDTWSAFESDLQRNARRTFAAAQRRRRVATWAVQAAAILLLISVATWSLLPGHRHLASISLSAAPKPQTQATSLPLVISEQQMLDMFPPGSCFLAEINGEKQLVFLDPGMAKEGVPVHSAVVSHN